MKTIPIRPLAASLLLAASLAGPAAAEVLNDVVLRVNNRIATRVDFETQLADRRQLLAASELPPGERERRLAAAGPAVLRDLYEELLLLSRADQLGLSVSDQDVERAVQQTRTRMGITSEEQFRQALAASGITEAQLRLRMRRNLLVQQVMGQEVQERIAPSDEELRAIYRREQEQWQLPPAVRLREVIVLQREGDDPAGVAALARQVRDELAAGATLEEVTATRAAEGLLTTPIDLGWVQRDDLDPGLAAAAWDLAPGGVSEPVAARGGLHVLVLEERRDATVRSFDEVRPEIEARERERRAEEEYPAYLRELEESSFVVIDPPPAAAAFQGLGTATDTPEIDALPIAEPAPAPAPPAEPPAALEPDPQG